MIITKGARVVPPALRIDFDRKSGTASHDGITVRFGEPIYEIARVLANLGYQGPATFYDERGMPCMETRTIQGMARRYRPTTAQKVENEAREKERQLLKKGGASC